MLVPTASPYVMSIGQDIISKLDSQLHQGCSQGMVSRFTTQIRPNKLTSLSLPPHAFSIKNGVRISWPGSLVCSVYHAIKDCEGTPCKESLARRMTPILFDGKCGKCQQNRDINVYLWTLLVLFDTKLFLNRITNTGGVAVRQSTYLLLSRRTGAHIGFTSALR